MLTRCRYVWVAGLLLAGCYSPSFQDGHLQCAASGQQCPKDYHCAANNTCWHNGRDPDAGQAPEVGMAASPDSPVSPDMPALDTQPLDAPVDVPVDGAIQPDALDATSPGDTGSVTVPLAQLANVYALVVCTKNFACCTQADLKGKSLATCESTLVSQLQPGIQAISDGIDRGRTVYYPDRAGQCLLGIEGVSCQSWPIAPPTPLPAGCDAIVTPKVGSGGACRSAVECITGFCSGATSTADGTCLPRAESGETCAQVLFQNSCQDGLFCDSTSICSATKPEGAVCTRARDCTSQTCAVAPDVGADAGNSCQPAACYSTGPFLAAGCSMGGRPAALPGIVLLVAAVVALLRRRRFHSVRPRN
jgi:MYXO-CTERM domain-containing protein